MWILGLKGLSDARLVSKTYGNYNVVTAQYSRDSTQSNRSEEIDRKTRVTRIVAWKDSFKILSKESVKARKIVE